MAFMEQEIIGPLPIYVIDTRHGLFAVAEEDSGELPVGDIAAMMDERPDKVWAAIREFSPEILDSPDDILEVERVENGWLGRYQAPGYMDSTDWTWGTSKEEVVEELESLYGDTD